MYCKNCGKEIFPDQNICSNCGAQQQPIQEKDSGGFGYGVLGFFFPFIGLILFLVLRESKPKAAGIGALAGEITKVLLFILLIVIQITSVRMSMMP